jgi:hypothetical protein
MPASCLCLKVVVRLSDREETSSSSVSFSFSFQKNEALTLPRTTGTSSRIGKSPSSQSFAPHRSLTFLPLLLFQLRPRPRLQLSSRSRTRSSRRGNLKDHRCWGILRRRWVEVMPSRRPSLFLVFVPLQASGSTLKGSPLLLRVMPCRRRVPCPRLVPVIRLTRRAALRFRSYLPFRRGSRAGSRAREYDGD